MLRFGYPKVNMKAFTLAGSNNQQKIKNFIKNEKLKYFKKENPAIINHDDQQ